VSFPSRIASSSVLNRSTVTTGPNTSSRTTVMSRWQPPNTVGRRKKPCASAG